MHVRNMQHAHAASRPIECAPLVESQRPGREWRDVALIPFIDAPLLLKEVAKFPPGCLTDSQKTRNATGAALAFAFHSSHRSAVNSPLPARLPHLPNARSVELRIGGAPPPDASRGVGDPPPEPTLPMRSWPALSMAVPFTMLLEKASLSLDCLGVTSRGLSWVLQLPGALCVGPPDLDTLAGTYLGETPVWVDWPYSTEARVVCVTNSSERCWRDRRGSLSRCGIHPKEWKALASELKEATRKKWGIDCGEVQIVLYVVRLLGHSRLPDGSIVRRWEQEPTPLPAQLIQPSAAHGAGVPEPVSGARDAAAARVTTGSKVLILEGTHAGCIGVVESVTQPPEPSAAELQARREAAEAEAAEAEAEAVAAVAAAEAEEAAASASAAAAAGSPSDVPMGSSEEEQLAWWA